jgi:regulator of sigma E protease
MVTDVVTGSPADKAGLKIGDIILNVVASSSAPLLLPNTVLPVQETVEMIQMNIASSSGSPISIETKRNGTIMNLSAVPILGLVDNKYAIGIAMSNVVDMKLPFFTAIYEGANYTVDTLKQTVVGLYDFIAQIFHGKANFSEITGPVGIAGIVGDAARLGFTYLLMITALISINLAVINFIPFPALDGGRILFVIIEAIIRRRIPAAFTNWVNVIGFGLLMLLMVIITYKDIVRLFVK